MGSNFYWHGKTKSYKFNLYISNTMPSKRRIPINVRVSDLNKNKIYWDIRELKCYSYIAYNGSYWVEHSEYRKDLKVTWTYINYYIEITREELEQKLFIHQLNK